MGSVDRLFSRTLAALLLCVVSGWAQQEGSIAGFVHDSTGAAIPNAEVSVTSNQQGFVRTVRSNDTGEYLVPGLLAGVYTVTVKAQGFQQFVVKDLVLRIAQKARADAALTLGQTNTEVTVSGENVAQVQTESAELSGTITNKQIDQLVLNGRNFTQLVTLIPGVSNQTGQDEGTVGVYGSVSFSVNGGRTEYNNWELDGGDNMDNGSNGTLNTYPNVDAIAEVKVLTSNYGAQYGRNGSATIETVTKSGTRDFHGDVFEFLRNEDFNGRNFFQDTRPEYKKHDFGYTVGGPVFIPKLYNQGRDKTFFFFSEEWRKELVPGQTFHNQVPSAAERNGDFSDVCPGANCPVNPATGQYYPNFKVPVTQQAQTLLPLIPTANSVLAGNSYFDAAPAQKTNYREELVRVDQNFSDKQRFFFRFIHDSWNTATPTPLWADGDFPTVGTSFVGPGVSLVANLTSTVSPSLLNEFVFSYTTNHITLNALGNAQRPADFDMPGIFDNGFRGLLPTFRISNTAEYGGGFVAGTGYFPWHNSNPTFTYKDNLTKIVGSHTLLFGASFIAAQKNEDSSVFQTAQGYLTFNGTGSNSTGNGFADFLVGNIYSFEQSNQLPKYYERYKIVEPYLQDDWHVSKKLTINLGLRVSLFGTYRDKNKIAYNWEARAYDPTQIFLDQATDTVTGNRFTGMVQCGASGAPAGCLTGHLFNPAPRIGFAYDPIGDGKTSIRGGYGVFFEHSNGNEGNTESLEGSPPLVQDTTVFNIPNYTSINSGSEVLGPLNVTAIPTKSTWPYVQQWNVSIQRQLPSNTILTVAYAGSKGTHLADRRDINQIFPVPGSLNPYQAGQVINTATDCGTPLMVNGNSVTGAIANNLNVACGNVSPDLYRPYPGYGSITYREFMANSSYNSLQVSARRYVGRLQLSAAYTWSHSIDDSSDGGDSNFVNSYNLLATRSSSNFDQRHLFNLSYVYDLPFFTQPGILHTLLGSWQWSGLVTFQTGTPFSVTNGAIGDNAGVGNGVGTGSYVDVVGDPHSSPSQKNTDGVIGPLLFNPGAFAEPTGLTFGNSGRNILNNPSRTNFDMGLFKRFPIKSEARAFEFRAEAFNVFNHTQWNGVNAGASCYGGANNSAGDLSCITTQTFLHPSGAHNPRIMQLSLKFLF
jgi:hypothetical protein